MGIRLTPGPDAYAGPMPRPFRGPSRRPTPRPAAPRTPPPAPAREALPLPTGVAALPAPPEFVDAAAQAGIEFEPGDVERLGRFLALVLAANAALNLTAIEDPAEAWRKHILDSLTLLGPLSELPAGARVIDVGTGAGFPGVPLAIVMPALRFTLLEATGKKCEFLRHAAKELGLTNVEVLAQRAEASGQDRGEKTGTGRRGAHRESYDAVVARAVGSLPTLAELTVPFAKIGGLVLLIKGAKAEEELTQAARALHELKAVHEATLETPTGRVVVLGKRAATPRDYPRRDGEPKRAPL